jgi:hypothetical protein
VAWWGGEGAAAGLKCAGVEKKGHRPPRVGEGRGVGLRVVGDWGG